MCHFRYALCLPAYAHEKPFWAAAVGSSPPLYLVPPVRYFYWAPGGTRGKPCSVAPFDSIWCGPSAVAHPKIDPHRTDQHSGSAR